MEETSLGWKAKNKYDPSGHSNDRALERQSSIQLRIMNSQVIQSSASRK